MALEEVNALGKAEFVARLGGVFEHSPWIAERAWHKRPFRSIDELHRAMLDAASSRDEKLELARAHPELAGGEALTVASTSEQARLGFNALSRKELEEMNRLNRSYRDKFGFPCIVALRLHADRQSVMAEMKRRLENDAGTELDNALEQVGHITRGRLEKIVHG
ncbi:MAG TPA: 2-oxo-4-hydroxy-4-carboxy-5-ureidoimidazoline decarboxylase [Burkholderiales bacterium]|nr:2-oxo-4-hydroxy-4-carboxy-5-ureidoimidazoline decarboxylase [Burkholderiales bacterium]